MRSKESLELLRNTGMFHPKFKAFNDAFDIFPELDKDDIRKLVMSPDVFKLVCEVSTGQDSPYKWTYEEYNMNYIIPNIS
ncbi:hypothetical protein HN924_02245 [Candidatus Woesearchaeota archaeon]|jgi:hypothetical protein|nr:hypothetical protein [Candidatus Woesearchaeota archaeon]MBT7062765.1 hypothetical protein [Candidatus Woesearchaeota archaeon]MBT7402409.1 hypothetical protein [Candidatus Woesearchaeota archaeon]